MAEADCDTCASMGYRSCDECANPVFPANLADARAAGLTAELCGYCLDDRGVPESSTTAVTFL